MALMTTNPTLASPVVNVTFQGIFVLNIQGAGFIVSQICAMSFRQRWRAKSTSASGFRRDFTSQTDKKIPWTVKDYVAPPSGQLSSFITLTGVGI